MRRALVLVAGLLLAAGPPQAFELKLVSVPAGEFSMGTSEQQEWMLRSRFVRNAPVDSDDVPAERPQHRVRISAAFQMGAFEVTVGQFRAFVEASGYKTDAEKSGRGARGFNRTKGEFESAAQYTWKNPGFPQDETHPVVCVSWNDAVAFCDWLSAREKATYRLPTEAQWEYACRAGTEFNLSFGDDPTLTTQYANVADVSLEKAHKGMTMRMQLVDLTKDPEDGFVYTAPVGRFKPNPFGLYDMHGNAWEWCRDRYQRFHYKEYEKRGKVAARDPIGPEKSDDHGDWRVLRGGSWALDVVAARASARLWNDQADAFCYAGFRVVRTAP